MSHQIYFRRRCQESVYWPFVSAFPSAGSVDSSDDTVVEDRSTEHPSVQRESSAEIKGCNDEE